MKMLFALFVLALFSATTPLRAAAADDAAFLRLCDEFTSGYLAWRPLLATGIGLHDWDGKLTDYSRASIDAETARLKDYQAKLAALNPASLSAQNRYDLRITQTGIQHDLFWLADARQYARDPRIYVPDIGVYVTQSFAPLEDRLQSVTAIASSLGDFLAAARANLDPILPRPAVETAIDDAKGAADFFEKDLVDAFAPVKDAALQTSLRAATARAAAELRAYAEFLQTQKLPGSDASFALGTERYQRMLACEMISLSPQEILDLGMKQLKLEQQRFADAARAIDPKHTPVEVFEAIQREHPAAENLVSETARNLEAIRQFLIDHNIVTMPSDVRAMVRETPPYLRHLSSAMMLTPGPLEKKATEAMYYVTPVENAWSAKEKEEWLTQFNYYDTDVTSIHEAYPGHYVQGLHIKASSVPKVEAIFNSYAYVEGWAHYSEQMLLEEGFGAGGDPIRAAKYRLAQSDEALLRLGRLCVSIRMHCQGMSLDDATRFFQDNVYLPAKPARMEAVRGTFDPEYLYYTLGKLQMLKLRDDYRKQEGPAFTLRRFHDAVLDHGAPPIRLLREILLKDKAIWDQILPTE
jgi:uncharacterized protein (DUF885 family)